MVTRRVLLIAAGVMMSTLTLVALMLGIGIGWLGFGPLSAIGTTEIEPQGYALLGRAATPMW